MAKATLHLWHSLMQYYKKGTALIKSTTSQKCDPTQLATHKNGISQKLYLTKMASQNLHIGFLKYYQHPANRTYTYNLTQNGKT